MEVGLLVIRVVVGLLFVGHGAQKLFGMFGGHGIAGTGEYFDSLGLRPGTAAAIAAGAVEIVGGALLALGFMTPLAAALLIATMCVAIVTVHRGSGLWLTNGGIEYNLVLMAVVFGVTAIGPGQWSLDDVIGLDLAGVGWGLAALAAGAVAAGLVVLIGRTPSRAEGPHPAH
jgi:putative oxidoreductase